MSAYTATIICEKCKKTLAVIKSEHHTKPDTWVPQDVHDRVIEAEWVYCDDCLNGDIAGGIR